MSFKSERRFLSRIIQVTLKKIFCVKMRWRSLCKDQARNVFLLGIFKRTSISIKKKYFSNKTEFSRNKLYNKINDSNPFSQSNPSFPLDRVSPSSPHLSKATPYHRTYQGHQNICFATLPAEKNHLHVVVGRSGNQQGHHIPRELSFAEGLPEPGFSLTENTWKNDVNELY